MRYGGVPRNPGNGAKSRIQPRSTNAGRGARLTHRPRRSRLPFVWVSNCREFRSHPVSIPSFRTREVPPRNPESLILQLPESIRTRARYLQSGDRRLIRLPHPICRAPRRIRSLQKETLTPSVHVNKRRNAAPRTNGPGAKSKKWPPSPSSEPTLVRRTRLKSASTLDDPPRLTTRLT